MTPMSSLSRVQAQPVWVLHKEIDMMMGDIRTEEFLQGV